MLDSANILCIRSPFATNEELVASAAGGGALYGVNLFPNEVDISSKPYAPVLAMPEVVDMYVLSSDLRVASFC